MKKVIQKLFSLPLLGLLIFTSFIGPKAFGQGNIQVMITGIPPVISSPFIDDLEQDYNGGLFQVQVTYNSSNQQPVDFEFVVALSTNGEQLTEFRSDPVSLTPGIYTYNQFFDEVPFSTSLDAVIADLNAQRLQQVIQSGKLPEGAYTLRITAEPVDQMSGVAGITGQSNFTVRYPQPPILMSPSDQSTVNQAIPTFAWTPVVGAQGETFQYHFLLVEMLPGQTPRQAINSNRVHHEQTLTGTTTFPYTNNYLNLDSGKEYAWQVTASDISGNLPISDDGESEIYTFTYNPGGGIGDENLDSLQTVPLVPNFAELVNLQNINITENSSAYVLNGSATLRMHFSRVQNGTADVGVTVTNLMVQKGSVMNPVVIGGSVRGQLSTLPAFIQPPTDLVTLNSIFWRFGQGVTVSGQIVDPNGNNISANGRLTVSQSGFSGQLTASGNPLFTVGENPVEMAFTELTLQFPEQSLLGTAHLQLFDGAATCELENINLQATSFSTDIDCDLDYPIYPVPQSQMLSINLGSVTGSFSRDWDNGTSDYDLLVQGDVNLQLAEQDSCGGSATFRINSESGFALNSFQPACTFPNPELDLGIARFSYENLDLSSLTYDSQNDSWDFNLDFDGYLSFPAFDGMTLPRLQGLSLSPSGIDFPDMNFSETDLSSLPPLTFGGISIRPLSFSANAFTFPWFSSGSDNEENNSSPWNFSMDLEIDPGNLSGSVPSCLKSQTFEIQDAQFSNGQFSGTASGNIVENCEIPLGGGFSLLIDHAGAEISSTISPDSMIINPKLTFQGSLQLADPFGCENPSDLSLGNSNLTINSSGIIEGSITNLTPSCPLQIDGFEATVTQADLNFGDENGQQTASLDMTADLQLSGTSQSASGSASINLLTGEFSDVQFDITQPFEWNIPSENPALTFQISSATIDSNGVTIDGRQQLDLGINQSIGVTFDNATIDFQHTMLTSGSIIFDEAFAFKLGIDTTDFSLAYQSVASDDTLDLSPGLLMKLAGTVTIDSSGLHATGTAQGEFKYRDWTLDSLSIEYSDDFALSLKPFGIYRGQADIYWRDQQIAIVDQNGLHLSPQFFGEKLVPDRIGLPKENIAYLELKKNGQMQVNVSTFPGNIVQIETKANHSVDFVFPVLQGTQATAPRIAVTFDSLRFNAITGAFVSGSVSAQVPANSSEFDLSRFGIPFTINQIVYEVRQIQNSTHDALFFDGKITLLDEKFGGNNSASLYIRDDWHLVGSTHLENLQTDVPLVQGSDRVVFEVDSLNGNIDAPILGGGNPLFQFDLTGGFLVNSPDGSPAARADIGAQVTQDEFRLTAVDTSGLGSSNPIDLGPVKLGIDKINNLTMSYDAQSQFTFFAGLDLNFILIMTDGHEITVPLKNVEIRSDIGLYIPEQDIHAHSTPKLDSPSFRVGIFEIEPLAFRMRGDTLNYYSSSVSDLLNFVPHVDLAISFPGLQNTVPAFAQTSITVNDAGFSDGVFTGTVEPFTFQGEGPFVPIGGDSTGIYVDSLAGGLQNHNGEQRFNIKASGYLSMPSFFSGSSGRCEQTRVSLGLTPAGGFVGSVNNFAACGEVEQGPLSIQFPNSTLDFAFTNQTQSATLDGNAIATISQQAGDITAQGNLKLDLITGDLLAGSLSINAAFDWYYPLPDSLFHFVVNAATIDSNGLVFNGSGSLNANGSMIGVNFANLTFNLMNGHITDGSVTIQQTFAMDVDLSQGNWVLHDTSDAVAFDPGLRMTMPSQLTINGSGLTVDGNSTASLFYNGESFLSLGLEFHQMNMGFHPLGVKHGRADFMLRSEGETPTRIAYYDSTGFNTDNVLGSSPLPDTLGLPSKDVAYLVLRDENGDLRVQSSNVSNGTSISTNDPLPLVIPSLENSSNEPLKVNVSFSDLVLNSTFDVTAGSIAVDLGENPVDLSPYGDFPLELTTLHFQNADSGYDLYAGAKFKLPEALNDVPVTLDTLKFDSNGFEQATFTAGEYTAAHTEDDSKDIVAHSFSDSALVFYVRGVQAGFGQTNTFGFTGDITSTLLAKKDSAASLVHFQANYTNGDWQFNTDASHLNNEIPVGSAKLTVNNLNVESDQDNFAFIFSGTLSMPDFLSDDFAITLNGLRVGTDGVSINSVSADGAVPQQFTLFSGVDTTTINSLNVSFTNNNDLILSMDGNIAFLGRDMQFQNLQIGTDGTFALGSGDVNLLSSSQEILGQYFVLDTLQIGVENNNPMLHAAGTTNLPAPFQASQTIGIQVDTDGNVQVDNPEFDLQNNPPSVSIGENFASLELTGFGFDLDPQDMSQTAIYASANLVVSDSIIEFGQPGSPENWGIRYQFGENLQWRITNSPQFHFDTDFFKIGITNIALADENGESFGAKIDGDVSLNIDDAISSDISMEGLTISADEVTMGDITGGSFDLMGVVSLTVGSIDYGDGDLTLKTQGGSAENPAAHDTTINTQAYVKIGGSSLDIMDGTFSGGFRQILYYKTTNSLYLNIDSAYVDLSDFAHLEASFEYLSLDNGDFKLQVAGGGSIGSPSEGSNGAVSFNALGKMSNINDVFSFGVFVKVNARFEIIPSVVTLTEVGGGFFYHTNGSDISAAVATAGHTIDSNRTPPWEKGNQNYDFAVVLFAGADIVSMGSNMSAVHAEALLVVTDSFFALDASGYILGQEGSLDANLYFYADWSNGISINAGGGVSLDYASLVTGTVNVDFQLYKPDQGQMVWAFNGGTPEGESIDILSIIHAEATIIASPDGFYFSMSISQGFDVWVIAIHSHWDMELWWIAGQNGSFGAYAEIGFDASIFGGAASIGGSLKGALIVDNGYLVYAAASAYVDVIAVFHGNITVWVSVKNGHFDGGRGPSKYDDLIDQARAQAQNMNNKMSDALAAVNNMKNAPEIFTMSDETKSAAGMRLLTESQSWRNWMANRMYNNETNLMGQPAPVIGYIKDLITYERPWPSNNNDLEALRTRMNDLIDDVSQTADSVSTSLANTRAAAINWQQEAAQLAQGVMNNPVQYTQQNWQGNNPPEFQVDSTQNAANTGSLSDLKADMDALDQMYQSAIDSIQSNIDRIKEALAPDIFITGGWAGGLVTNPFTGEMEPSGGDVEVHYTPGANDISERYVQATKAIDKFYAKYISRQWMQYQWVNGGQLSTLRQYSSQLKGGLINSIQDYSVQYTPHRYNSSDYGAAEFRINSVHFWQGGSQSQTPKWGNLSSSQQNQAQQVLINTDHNTLATVAANRMQYVLQIDPNTSYSSAFHQSNQFESDMNDFWSNEEYGSFFGNFVKKGMELWFEMPELGYITLRDSAIARARRLSSLYHSNMDSMLSAHEEFTGLVDDLYNIEADMTTTLFGLVDVYSNWRAEAMGDSAAQQWVDLKNSLQHQLTPPSIGGVNLSYDLEDFQTKMTLNWAASHPSGYIVETSYNLSRGSNATNLSVGGMLSVGGKNELTRYAFKENQNDDSHNYRLILRARGPAGNTMTRNATFAVPVDEHTGVGNTIPSNMSPSVGGQDVLNEDTTPPSTPSITLPYTERSRMLFNENYQLTNYTSYWTHDDSKITFQVATYDAQSDIAQIEYALGTSEGATNVVSWTVGQGHRVNAGSSITGVENWVQEMTIHNLELQTGTDYYLSVRSMNGDSLMSNIESLSDPIKLDNTPPSDPVASASGITNQPSHGFGGYIRGSSVTTPDMQPPPNVQEYEPKITVNWNSASDQQSGIKGYEYVISEDSDPENAFSAATNVQISQNTSIEITGEPLNFTDSIYVHIRAVNYAGLGSENALTYGPVVPNDPTPPTTTIIAATARPDKIGFYYVRPPYDAETDLGDVQYAIGTSQYSRDVQSWTNLDFDAGDIFVLILYYAAVESDMDFPSDVGAPFVAIPSDNLPTNQELYIQLRTKNSQGKISARSYSGPVVLDDSPPETPSLNLIDLNNGNMMVQANDVEDPESGIYKVEFKVIDYSNVSMPTTIKDWTEMNDGGSWGYLGTADISAYNFDKLRVKVRVTNKNYMQTTASDGYNPFPVSNYGGGYYGGNWGF